MGVLGVIFISVRFIQEAKCVVVVAKYRMFIIADVSTLPLF